MDLNYDDAQIMKRQTIQRIIVKAILYHVLSFFIVMYITYLFTNNYTKSIKIGFIVELLNSIFYFIYEYYWENITWGMRPII